MPVYKFIPPTAFVGDASADWRLGRKSSGVMALEYALLKGADTNVILTLPLPIEVDAAGIGRALSAVVLHHFISAASAGVTPIISGTCKIYEVALDASKAYAGGLAAPASANMAGLPNATASAGYIAAQQVSGVLNSPTALSAAGVAIASLWTSGQDETFSMGKAPQYEGQETDKTHPYIPRLSQRTFALEISASVGASAVWEIYGATAIWA